MPKTRHYRAKGSIANTPLAVSLISAVLGGAVVLALVVAATPVLPAIASAAPVWVRPQLGIYLSAIALFHLLEFWITAGWNYQKLSVDGESALETLTDDQRSSSTTRPTTTLRTLLVSPSILSRRTCGLPSLRRRLRRRLLSCSVSFALIIVN
jgi:hypothetical protein